MWASRQSARVANVRALATHFHAHVVTFDYRGFGDCSGEPTEDGIAADARAAWDWVAARAGIRNAKKTEQCSVVIYGQSLGSAVAARLVDDLFQEKVASDGQKHRMRRPVPMAPSGVILDAPFTSLAEAALHLPTSRLLLKCLALAPAPPSWMLDGKQYMSMAEVALAALPDKWETERHATRLVRNASREVLLAANQETPEVFSSPSMGPNPLRCVGVRVLVLAHSRDEVISLHLSQKVHRAACDSAATVVAAVNDDMHPDAAHVSSAPQRLSAAERKRILAAAVVVSKVVVDRGHKVMKRYHVDAFTSYEWVAALGPFLDDCAGKDRRG